MDFEAHKRFLLTERSFGSLIKKEIHSIAETLPFSKKRLAELDIIISEMSSNLVKFALGKGEILCRRILEEDKEGIELISLDRGPGIPNPEKMMEDGISSVGSLGQGLGAIKRLSDVFDIYSVQNWGTIILSRVFCNKAKTAFKAKPKFSLGAVLIPKPSETLSGDGFAYKVKGDLVKLLCTDGLGHGPEAHAASRAAIEYFLKSKEESPSEVLTEMHNQVRKTRGLVAGVGFVDTKNGSLSYAGIGNISARLQFSDRFKAMMSYNGILGHVMPRSINNSTVSSVKNQFLILCSDGIKSKFDLSMFPNIGQKDPSVIASAILLEYFRGTDDAVVIVFKS